MSQSGPTENPTSKQYEQVPPGEFWTKADIDGCVQIGTHASAKNNNVTPFLRCFYNNEEDQFRLWSEISNSGVSITEDQWIPIGRETSPSLIPDIPGSRCISRDHCCVRVERRPDGKFTVHVWDKNSHGGTFCNHEPVEEEAMEGEHINEFTLAGNQEGTLEFWNGAMQGATETAAEGKYTENQDGLYLNPEQGVIAVADGIGGYGGGAKACAHILRSFHKNIKVRADLGRSMANANRYLMQAMPNKKAGATLAAAKYHVQDNGKRYFEVASIGDARVLIISKRTGRLKYRSKDQSRTGELLARGEIDEKGAFEHKERNVVYNAISADLMAKQPEHYHFEVEQGDIAVVLTDGIGDVMSDEEIAAYCMKSGPSAVHEIMKIAKSRQNKQSYQTIIQGRVETINAVNADNIAIGMMQI
ncbi:SpoIIE family protein phosphatase [Candidatus Peregrinibacteria bacterium]|jgi:PPM family protein phosphatase|nr:SpoIIE family protein phosphatase [Candidatus Peregrinibacteria bacterium]MBT7737029.1 SpoIIE family protein phosphatase [Candidatus Peregrinibacteria bacterium]